MSFLLILFGILLLMVGTSLIEFYNIANINGFAPILISGLAVSFMGVGLIGLAVV